MDRGSGKAERSTLAQESSLQWATLFRCLGGRLRRSEGPKGGANGCSALQCGLLSTCFRAAMFMWGRFPALGVAFGRRGPLDCFASQMYGTVNIGCCRMAFLAKFGTSSGPGTGAGEE